MSIDVNWGILHRFINNRCNISLYNFKNTTAFLFTSVMF